MIYRSPSALGSLADDDYDIFPELATTLYCWVARLYQAVAASGIEQIFFLSREGQPLKRMFDAYCARMGSNVQSRYLEVSRRSTLLPSLSALETEQFETLFRQYRRMSLFEFLSSLGLECHCSAFVKALGLPTGAEECREEDFPTSALFQRLQTLPLFADVFETERQGRRGAFIRYLTDLAGGALPQRLVIVDVGWKGTIQDNLFAALCKAGDLPVKSVEGYYLGLVAPGQAGPNNIKHGLLFSCVGERSPHFHVFNENRALFEVVLAADHGSVVSYEVDMLGRGRPVHGDFEEEAMLVSQVFPVLQRSFCGFNKLLSGGDGGRPPRFKDVVRGHARMVFYPTQRELAWFSSVFHVENYGVFERSHFGGVGHGTGLRDRMNFLFGLRRRGRGTLGFWPWRTLNERGGRLVASVYAKIRQIQS